MTAGVTSKDISVVEITGGACECKLCKQSYMKCSPPVQAQAQTLLLLALPMDGSIALGAALVCNKLYANEDEVPQPVPDSPFTPLGMSSQRLCHPANWILQ